MAIPRQQHDEIPIYPTGSLDFLDKLYRQPVQNGHAHNASGKKPSLKFIIVGAGLGGLAAAIALSRKGHKVTILEQAPAPGEVGAGIQIPPNSLRSLIEWGLDPYLAEHVVEPGNITFRRWKNGKVIGLTKLKPDFRETFDAPYYVVHRAHFHDAMYRLAIDLGVDIILSACVNSYDAETPSVTTSKGQKFTADLIVAADGFKSTARKKILGGVDCPPRRKGFAVYRATVDVDKIRADPDISWIIEKPNLNLWVGDMRHVMSYMISGGRSFNMVWSHPDSTDPSTWDQNNALQGMREHFEGWDPTLLKLMDKISTTAKWPLVSGSTLQRWVAPSCKLVILGDAAHAMLPYMSQGAAMAVEDAAALAEVLDQVESTQDIPDALHVWESVRIERSSQMQQASLINGKLWHFADGPEQEARDAAMRFEVEGIPCVSSPNQWTDPTTQRWCYGYRAEESVRKAWALWKMNAKVK